MTAAPPQLPTSPSDPDLLRAFLQDRHSPAFPQLVQRYLPQVHAHARRLLHDPHRAEDAAQAVFLLLAQRAHALATAPSLAAWLYKTTHFTCKNIRRIDARRKRHEQQRARMQPAPDSEKPSVSELELHLDHILQKLPARDRELLLLRFVHAYPLPEIARLTNTTESAAKKRLQRAIASLRRHFAARNLSLPAAFTPATLLAPPRLTAHLATTTTTAALSPTTSLLALAKSTTTLMLASKLKLTAAVTLAAILLLTTTTFLLSRSPSTPITAPSPTPAALAGAGGVDLTPIATTQPGPTDPTPDLITIHGIVLDPTSKPLPNATISLPAIPNWLDKYTTHIITQTTAGPDGRFQLSYHKSDLARFSDGYGASMATAWNRATLFASADGYGLAWSRWNHTDPRGDLRLQLTPDNIPIRGQLLSADGHPAPNVSILVEMLLDGTHETLDAAQAKNPDAAEALLCDLPFLSTGHTPITTDASGHFEIRGLGRNRIAFLHVCSPTIPFARLEVITSQTAPPPRKIPEPSGDVFTFITHPATFTYTAPPALSIDGTVRDAITHQPVPNVLVESTSFSGPFQGIDAHGLCRATTDAAGHYHLDGFPRAPATKWRNTIVVVPPRNTSYFLRTFIIDDTHQPATTLDIDLHKGILITGKVTDKLTGQPQPAQIEYTTYKDNPHTADLPEFKILSHGMSEHDHDQFLCTTEPDGSYQVVAVPGKAVIGVFHQSNRYLKGLGAADIPALTSRRPLLFDPVPVPNLYNFIKEVDVAENAPPPTVDFQLDPGATARINLVDDKNQPITNCQVVGDDAANYSGWAPHTVAGSSFTATALTPDSSRVITVLNPGRNLGAVEEFFLADLKNGAFTIHLQPLATITGRLLDSATDAPIPNTELMAEVGISGSGGSDLPTITTDAAGNFRYTLPAGQDAFISVFSGPYAGASVAQHLSPDPAQTQSLGDIKIHPRRVPHFTP